MVNENSPAIAEEYKRLLCDVLNERGITDKKICSKVIDAFSTTEKHMSVDDFSFMLQEKDVHIDMESISLALSTFSEYGFARELQFEGEEIHVVKNSNFGSIVLEVKGSRFAVGRGQAQKILVYEN